MDKHHNKCPVQVAAATASAFRGALATFRNHKSHFHSQITKPLLDRITLKAGNVCLFSPELGWTLRVSGTYGHNQGAEERRYNRFLSHKSVKEAQFKAVRCLLRMWG